MPLEEIATEPPPKNSPRIVKMTGGQNPQFFILVEQDVLCEAGSMSQAIFIWFSLHYILTCSTLHLFLMLEVFSRTWFLKFLVE